jgi:hypothetical protein
MPRKKVVEVEELEGPGLEGPGEEVEESFEVESEEKQAYRELIENYAKQNPVKYAQKKEALLEKLNSM